MPEDKNVDVITDDLNKFSDEFFQKPNYAAEADAKKEAEVKVGVKEEKEEEAPEEEAEAEDESEVDDTGDDENDTSANDDDEEEEKEEEPLEEEPEPKPKRNTAKERINELTAEKREAQRERDAIRREFESLKAAVEKSTPKEEPKGLREQLPADAPHPDTKDEDGEPLYELGEFDPKYIRDLTRFTINEENKKAKEEMAKEAREQAIETSRKELADAWIVKLDKAEESLPDIREHLKDMVDVFVDIEPVYGEYLASTVMSSEFGPEIMDYLSQNIGEARKIVASGPAAATLAIGRLEAKFVLPPKQEIKSDNPTKVSNAPDPPESRTKGQGGKFAVRADTDNLDAFEKEFYKKR